MNGLLNVLALLLLLVIILPLIAGAVLLFLAMWRAMLDPRTWRFWLGR